VTVDDYPMPTATLGDWLKILAPISQKSETKLEPTAACTRDFSRVLSKSQVNARNFDRFIALLAHVVIGRNNYFCNGFSIAI